MTLRASLQSGFNPRLIITEVGASSPYTHRKFELNFCQVVKVCLETVST